MVLTESSWLQLWEFVEISGAIIVTVGVTGEYIADFTKFVKGKARKTRLRKISTLVLIAGLAIELAGLVTTSHAFNLLVSKANDDAKRAGTSAAASYESAMVAEQKAGVANERAANTESDNLVLKKQLLELEVKMQPRQITSMQITNFIKLLKGIPRTPIKVFRGMEDTETAKYAGQIRAMLDAGGFGTNNEGVVRLGSGYLTQANPIEPTPQFSVVFMIYGTNSFFRGDFSIPNFFVSSYGVPIVLGRDPVAILGAVYFAFNQIGITTGFVEDDQILKPGEVGIWVPQKNQ